MSNEEKEAIEILKLYFFDNPTLNITKYVNIVLNLIEKQSKEIEELKANKGYHLGFIDGGIAKRYEYEDKIKAKIEEYEDYGTSIYYGLRSNGKAFHQAVRIEVKEILQSLLEKE